MHEAVDKWAELSAAVMRESEGIVTYQNLFLKQHHKDEGSMNKKTPCKQHKIEVKSRKLFAGRPRTIATKHPACHVRH